MMASGAVRARPLIIGTKRFNRDGLVISALVHFGILAVALLFARAAPQDDAPEEAIPPDAMQVAIVTPKDIPRYSGTPSMLRTSGTEHAGQSEAPPARNEQPPTVPAPPQPKDQHQAQRNAPPKPQERQEQPPPQSAPPQAKEPPLPQADAAQVATAQPAPDPAAPSTEQTPDVPDTAATAAYLALAGGRLGGGFMAPPIDSPLVGYDFTEPFRELVSSCGASPARFDPNEKFSIVVRVFLNRDGTLAAAPQLLDSNPSTKQQELMQDFVSGLQKCQPYTMLPPDRYTQWKTLDLVVRPHMSLAQ
jgi:type IV secretory pathway VirB10-like protein